MDSAEPALVPTLLSTTPSFNISAVNDLDLSHLTTERQNLVPHMLRQYDSMWSGFLGQMSIFKHQIDSQPGTRPFLIILYRAGSATR